MKNSNINMEDHFRDVTKMIELAKGAQREIDEIELSLYSLLQLGTQKLFKSNLNAGGRSRANRIIWG